MQSRGLLMIEHRLIERMILQVKNILGDIQRVGMVDTHFIDLAVDFVRTYADRTHHGKEEDILFRALAARPLSDDVRRAMEELIEEHVVARQATRALIDANNRHRTGDRAALALVTEALRQLVELYPRHIRKEDKVFFPAARAYFTEAEDGELLAAFNEFDRGMIHEKYRTVVASLERAGMRPAAGRACDVDESTRQGAQGHRDGAGGPG